MLFFDLVRYSFNAKRTARLTREQVKELQQKKFRKLVQFISLHSSYYKQVIKKNKIDVNNCNPEDFPILTKAEVIQHFDEIVTDPRITKAKIADFLEHSSDPNDLFLNQYYIIR